MRKLKEYIKFRGDKTLWTIIIVLMVASVFLIYSSTGRLAYNEKGGNTLFYVWKHAAFLLGSLGVLFFMQAFSWKNLYKWSFWLLILAGGLLLMAIFGGSHINGAGRWIKIPIVGVTFQPSEFAKIAVVIYISRLLTDYHKNNWSTKEVLKQLAAPAIVIFLIFWDNFSTSALITVVCFLLFILGKMQWKLLGKLMGVVFTAFVLLIVLGVTFPDVVGKRGRVATIVNRLTAFVVGSDFKEEGKKDYNMQSDHACMAIAQGGLTGRGPGNSIQRNMLPHAYSDFIYAILIEEYGFGGGLLVMIFYLVILFRSVRIGQNVLKYSQDSPRGQPNIFPALLVLGLGILITLQALFHMGVNTGALPVTGQTLPLMSLGGTSLLFTSATLGIILNIAYTFSQEYLEKHENRLDDSFEEDDCFDKVEFTEYEREQFYSDENSETYRESIEEEFENEGRRALRELKHR